MDFFIRVEGRHQSQTLSKMALVLRSFPSVQLSYEVKRRKKRKVIFNPHVNPHFDWFFGLFSSPIAVNLIAALAQNISPGVGNHFQRSSW